MGLHLHLPLLPLPQLPSGQGGDACGVKEAGADSLDGACPLGKGGGGRQAGAEQVC